MESICDISYDEIIKIEHKLLNIANEKMKQKKQNAKTTQKNKSKIIKRDSSKLKNKTSKQPLLPKYLFESETNTHIIEAGVDEAGRGPMFGRVYTACVVLPTKEQNPNFKFDILKDSKRFTSKKKLNEAYEYIIENAIEYSIQYMEAETIDAINIRNATLQCMVHSILHIKKENTPQLVLVDGCDFPRKFHMYDTGRNEFEDNETKLDFESICIEGGDNLYCSIAASSILAKVSRDRWIEEMCIIYPYLDELYGMNSHKGYGTKKHIDAIKKYGITKWHRKSFGICKNSKEFDCIELNALNT